MITDIINIVLYVNDRIVKSKITSINDSYSDLRDILVGIKLMSSSNYDKVIGLAKIAPFSDGDLLKRISDDNATEEEKTLLQKAEPLNDSLYDLSKFAEDYYREWFNNYYLKNFMK